MIDDRDIRKEFLKVSNGTLKDINISNAINRNDVVFFARNCRKIKSFGLDCICQ
ncbi:hypothetical protein [Kiloniella majae]|uniref:hypothetical protein n=1 Tax=Kiloniella majae TaxID=1938558 RepID=UPI001FE49E00|nr:hypothetical protein [Kiloniella majae]